MRPIIGADASVSLNPSAEQIYQAAQSGHLQQAEQMIGQVLQNHPRSGTDARRLRNGGRYRDDWT